MMAAFEEGLHLPEEGKFSSILGMADWINMSLAKMLHQVDFFVVPRFAKPPGGSCGRTKTILWHGEGQPGKPGAIVVTQICQRCWRFPAIFFHGGGCLRTSGKSAKARCRAGGAQGAVSRATGAGFYRMVISCWSDSLQDQKVFTTPPPPHGTLQNVFLFVEAGDEPDTSRATF